MNLSSTRHLGGTATAGSNASGSRYASHTVRTAHTFCWMELAVFPKFPDVPSLSGTHVQGRRDLLTSTKGAGAPNETSLMLQIELFDDECPQLCANFRRLCNGESATRQGTVYCHQGLTPSYRGTYFHKIIPSYCAQGGDITMRVVPGGSNSYSSAGRGWLSDENKKRRHNEVGLVSMANNGPNSNGSQFFITTSAGNECSFNGRHCCIGRVVSGLDLFLQLVAPCGDKEGRPSRYVVVVDCGEGKAPTSTFAASSSVALAQTGSSGPNEAAADAGFADTEKSTVVVAEEGADHPDANAFFSASAPMQSVVHRTGDVAVPSADAVNAARPPQPHLPVVEVGAVTAASPNPLAAELPVQPLKSSIKKSALAASNKHVTYKE